MSDVHWWLRYVDMDQILDADYASIQNNDDFNLHGQSDNNAQLNGVHLSQWQENCDLLQNYVIDGYEITDGLQYENLTEPVTTINPLVLTGEYNDNDQYEILTQSNQEIDDYTNIGEDLLVEGLQDNHPMAMLNDAPVWRTLNQLQCEMMFTVTGRKIFPSISISMTNMDQFQYYIVALEIKTADSYHYRFDKSCSKWKVKTELDDTSAGHSSKLFIHAKSPQLGSYYNDNAVEFADIRIARGRRESRTEQRHVASDDNVYHVSSSRKYCCIIHIVNCHHLNQFMHNMEISDSSGDDSDHSKEESLIGIQSYAFDSLNFFATTHYRNPLLSAYKIQLNIHSTGQMNQRPISPHTQDRLRRLCLESRPQDPVELPQWSKFWQDPTKFEHYDAIMEFIQSHPPPHLNLD
ncbi:hypothetical protein MP228_003099 [Amoeboaphelidium protococcarum]|nr:hypothetical protein MP228_003099 [Amoeboaphelidium protococcarum]